MPQSFAGVTFAQEGDEDALFHTLQLAEQENAFFPMAPAKVRDAIRQGTAKYRAGIGVVHGPEGEIIASVGLFWEQFWYSEQWWMVDRWNFVHPEHRRSAHAKNLIEWSKWFSDQLGLDLLMAVLSNERTEAKVRLYRRQMPYVGGFFYHQSAKNADRATV